GGGGSAGEVEKIKDLPIWVFHGAKDNVVPLRSSEAMVDALKEAGAKDVKFTVYPEAGHDSWTETYNDPAIYEWLGAQKRQEGGARPPASEGDLPRNRRPTCAPPPPTAPPA